MKLRFVMVILSLALPSAAAAQVPASEWAAVARALGREGEEKDGVYRLTFPRSDLRVRVGDVPLRPALALTSWAAFRKVGNATMAMGDLVLKTGELSPVVSRLLEAGLEITGIHNHLAGEAPRMIYVHFHGRGQADALALALRAALQKTETPLGPGPALPSVSPPVESDLDAALLSRILGRAGSARGGVVNFTVPRAEKIRAGGAELGPRMGLGTVINFQGHRGEVVTTGDFVLLAGEVQPVVRTLREHGIEVTALHNHLLDEQPRLFFLHFWGRGPAEKLARGLRAALDRAKHAPVGR